MSFEEEFLAKIAKALNVPADLLGQDYLGTLTQIELQAYEASRRFWREFYRMQDAYERTYLNPAIISAMLYAAIWTVESYCGYDPQKLLPAPDKRRTFYERMEVWREGGDLAAHGLQLPDRRRYPLLPHDLDYIEAASEESFMQRRTPTWPHKMAVVDMDRIGEVDFSGIELRALLAMEGIRCVVIRSDRPSGEIAGNPQMSLYALGAAMAKERKTATVAKKAPPSYMQHDPTKQHGRRRRK